MGLVLMGEVVGVDARGRIGVDGWMDRDWNKEKL